MFAVHAAVFPLDRQRTGVVHRVQCADNLLEVYPAPAERAKIPAAVRVAEVQVAGEDAARPLSVTIASFMCT